MNVTAKVTCVLNANNYLGETPVWSVQEQALYWINCEQPSALHRWHYASRRHDSWALPSRIGGVALRNSMRPVVTLSDGIYDFDLGNARLTLECRSPLPSYVGL